MDQRLLAVDLSAVFHRNWHGTSESERAVLPDGRGVWAITGTILTILRALNAAPYTHLLVAAEAHGASAGRREIFADYKAHRNPPVPELVSQMRDCWNVLAAAGWPVTSFIRKEADDVLASAATHFSGEVDILTGDRDMFAVCDERVSLLLFAPASTLPRRCGPEQCQEIFGVEPHQVCEWKALAGDTSDGIPGVTGIGPRGAGRILRHYQTLRDAFADASMEGIPSRLRNIFAEGRDAAAMSWRLARLDTSLAAAQRCKPVADCFGEERADGVRNLGFGGLARHFVRVPHVSKIAVPA